MELELKSEQGRSGGSGGSGGNYSSSGFGSSADNNTGNLATPVSGTGNNDYTSVARQIRWMYENGKSESEIANILEKQYNLGNITPEQFDHLSKTYNSDLRSNY